ncbi:MAG TPA: OmpH family outer membrane protein [Desulfobacteraceae bacterium]|nr:OmpH family outer membrane protein [Desulfobacteraceae bacterium]HPQ28797.1 OmpH family outer membrane protein [Desulfobacteraceae bacterium]
MKKFFFLFIGIAFIMVSQNYAFSAEKVKIGVIDVQEIQDKSKTFAKIRDELKVKFDALQKKLDTEQDELMKLEEELKKQSMMLSLDAKEDRQKELAKKRRYFKYLYDEYTQEMKDEEIEARKKVGKAIEKIVAKIAEKEGYTLILERRGVGLLYCDNDIDITRQVIQAYDLAKE